jgi:YHS domain-containing protein
MHSALGHPAMQGDNSSPRDPVCGQTVAQSGRPLQSEYADVTYQFCSRTCMDRFLEQPDIFTNQPGLGRVAQDDRALRDDEHIGEVDKGRQVRLDGSAPAADPGG